MLRLHYGHIKPNTNARRKKERRIFSLNRKTKENYAKIFCGQWHELEICADHIVSVCIVAAALPYQYGHGGSFIVLGSLIRVPSNMHIIFYPEVKHGYTNG